jgi:hypothetical protein
MSSLALLMMPSTSASLLIRIDRCPPLPPSRSALPPASPSRSGVSSGEGAGWWWERRGGKRRLRRRRRGARARSARGAPAPQRRSAAGHRSPRSEPPPAPHAPSHPNTSHRLHHAPRIDASEGGARTRAERDLVPEGEDDGEVVVRGQQRNEPAAPPPSPAQRVTHLCPAALLVGGGRAGGRARGPGGVEVRVDLGSLEGVGQRGAVVPQQQLEQLQAPAPNSASVLLLLPPRRARS